MRNNRIAVILGIRPDVIRGSLILDHLRAAPDVDVRFIWSGQHYSDNLKDVFFRQLGVQPPDVELAAAGDTDAAISAGVIARLYPVLAEFRPAVAVFLGDTNTVLGCLAAAQLNVPIVHIEGCMRSYDWRMPEEKFRSVIDHLADVIYAYLDEYKAQGIREGLAPERIVVTGNPIVDVLQRHYHDRRAYYDELADARFFRTRGLEPGAYYLMTCHRRENVHDDAALDRILGLLAATDRRVYFPASYRTQKVLAARGLVLPPNVTVADPVGYEEFLVLLTRARGVLTDSGTVVEEACALQVPAVQMRRSTERPQVYDVGACVKFDPSEAEPAPPRAVLAKLEALVGKRWPNPFGDGHASRRIADDLLARLREGRFDLHRPEDYHLDIRRSYRSDGL